MAKRGPKPTPIEELKRRGSWRAKIKKKKKQRKMKKKKPPLQKKLSIVKLPKEKAAPAKLIRPQNLTGEGRKVWDRLRPVMERAGKVDEIYRDTFRCLCDAIADYEDLVVKAKEEEPVLTGKNDYKYQNPTYVMRNRMREQVVKLSALFGMSPSDIDDVAVKDKTKDEDDKSRFFKTKKSS